MTEKTKIRDMRAKLGWTIAECAERFYGTRKKDWKIVRWELEGSLLGDSAAAKKDRHEINNYFHWLEEQCSVNHLDLGDINNKAVPRTTYEMVRWQPFELGARLKIKRRKAKRVEDEEDLFGNKKVTLVAIYPYFLVLRLPDGSHTTISKQNLICGAERLVEI